MATRTGEGPGEGDRQGSGQGSGQGPGHGAGEGPPDRSGAPQAAAWAGRVGRRVVVRYRLDGSVLTDALGELLAAGDGELVVATRRGQVRVPLAAVVAGKEVPPRPVRAAAPHLALSIGGLEAVTARHWQPRERAELGGWLLRAAGGFTNRANSVLPLGDPGLPPAEVPAAVHAWYAARGLPARASVAGPAEGGVAPDGDTAPHAVAAAVLGAAGWTVVPDGSALVLTAATAGLRSAGSGLPPGLTMDLAGSPDDAWLRAYRYRGQVLPAHAVELLTSAREQVFASVRAQGATVAVARGSAAAGWGGISAVEVDPAHRRQGLARVLLAGVARWLAERGAASTFLQVAESNRAAQQLYLSAGFVVHHRYAYLQAPDGPVVGT